MYLYKNVNFYSLQREVAHAFLRQYGIIISLVIQRFNMIRIL